MSAKGIPCAPGGRCFPFRRRSKPDLFDAYLCVLVCHYAFLSFWRTTPTSQELSNSVVNQRQLHVLKHFKIEYTPVILWWYGAIPPLKTHIAICNIRVVPGRGPNSLAPYLRSRLQARFLLFEMLLRKAGSLKMRAVFRLMVYSFTCKTGPKRGGGTPTTRQVLTCVMFVSRRFPEL